MTFLCFFLLFFCDEIEAVENLDFDNLWGGGVCERIKLAEGRIETKITIEIYKDPM